MLSYRHYFHAGNHADVLKHLLQVQILRYLTLKDKPLMYLDTHAGAGAYALDVRREDGREPEYLAGIGRLWDKHDLPEALAEYMALVREFNGSGNLRRYPGSPWFARRILRPSDRLFLYELHSADYKILVENTGGDKGVKVLKEDGFAGCIANMPPVQRRALVLMDPAYEIKSDYRRVVEVLLQSWKRFPAGVYALWYPVVERHRIDRLISEVQDSDIRNVSLFELNVAPEHIHHGMTGSGMLVVNPPWTLHEKMQQALPWLADVLAVNRTGSWRIETIIPE